MTIYKEESSQVRGDGCCQRSMFGLKSSITKCCRQNIPSDFDDLRIILSYSKLVENCESWIPYVEEDGSLFYVDVGKHCNICTKQQSVPPCKECDKLENNTKQDILTRRRFRSSGHYVKQRHPKRGIIHNNENDINKIKEGSLRLSTFDDKNNSHTLGSESPSSNCESRSSTSGSRRSSPGFMSECSDTSSVSDRSCSSSISNKSTKTVHFKKAIKRTKSFVSMFTKHR